MSDITANALILVLVCYSSLKPFRMFFYLEYVPTSAFRANNTNAPAVSFTFVTRLSIYSLSKICLQIVNMTFAVIAVVYKQSFLSGYTGDK